ncbi:MAG: ShlB/FhaC/HecB family hemolysin secretion/activation protein [Psychroflexus sp.]
MNRITIKFLIILGITNSIWAQDIILHTQFSSDSLVENNKQKFNSVNEAETHLDFKIDSLKTIGYLFLSNNTKFERNTLFAHIELNQKIDSIHINIRDADLKLFPKKSIVNDKTIAIPYFKIDKTLNYAVHQLKESGSAFGKVTLINIRKKGKSLEAELKVDTGQKRTIDKINIKGYSMLSETYVSRYSNLKIGNTFIESEIQKKTEQLNNIPFINVKKPTEVLFKKDSTELFIYIDKVKSNSFDGFLGFSTNEENNFQLNGYLNMVLLNNLNFGERLGIIYKNNGSGQQIFEGNIKMPFVLKSPLSLGASVRIFRRDSLFTNNTQNIDLSYQINERLNFKGGLDFTNSTNIQIEEINSLDDIADFKSTFYGVGLEYLKMNSRRGFNEDTFINIEASLGKREAEIDSDQYKLSIEGQHQISVNYRNKIYINLNSQFLISDSYYNNELFRFGGINSIRGFAENSLLANRFAILKTEYRYLLDDNLFVNSVLDIGNYQNKTNKINENIMGYGMGLGLKTEAGIFRLVLANAASSNQKSNLSNSKIHIGFVSYF